MCAGIGDFLGNGNSDILWQNNDGQAAIWLMNGTTLVGGSGVAIGPNLGPSWHVVGTGDFHDGGAPAINPSTLSAGMPAPQMSFVATDVAGTTEPAGVFDSDILWQNNDGQAQIWLMNGSDVVSMVTVGQALGPTWHIVDTGDFNRDGNSDILWQNNNGQAQIWLMNGTKVVSEELAGGVNGPTWHAIATGDFHGGSAA